MLLQCSYKGREFVRVGYYVNNDYHTPELCENPQLPTDFSLLVRSILAEEPRITRFAIPWDDEENADFIPDDEIDADRMDVSGDEEDAEDAENEEGVVVEDGSGLAENDFDENDEDDEEDDDDDIENVEHDLEEDEEKFKQKRHGVVNSSVDNLAAVFTPTQVS